MIAYTAWFLARTFPFSLRLLPASPRIRAELELLDAMGKLARFQVDGEPLRLGPDGDDLLPYHVRGIVSGLLVALHQRLTWAGYSISLSMRTFTRFGELPNRPSY